MTDTLPFLPAASTGGQQSTASGNSLATWSALLLGSLGALVGYYAALFQSADTILWTATGCAAGLCVGALWIRWKLPKN